MDKNETVWKYFGEKDPYFGVVAIDEMRGDVLVDDARKKFFASGDEHVERLWHELEANFHSVQRPRRALDFGCGVGRVAIPLARRCDEVVGIDISSAMIDEARRNAASFGVDNVT